MVKQFRLVRWFSWTKKLLKRIHFWTWNWKKKNAERKKMLYTVLHTLYYLCGGIEIRVRALALYDLLCCVYSLSYYEWTMRHARYDRAIIFILFTLAAQRQPNHWRQTVHKQPQRNIIVFNVVLFQLLGIRFYLERQARIGQVTHKKSNHFVSYYDYWSGKVEGEKKLIKLRQSDSYSYSMKKGVSSTDGRERLTQPSHMPRTHVRRRWLWS